MTHQEIWQENVRICRERREAQRQVMDEYDQTVYYPARQANIKACEEIGHTWGSWEPNGLCTHMFRTCHYCGEVEKDDT